MEGHRHNHQHTRTSKNHWLKRHRRLTYIALGILGYFLLIEHREHVIPMLPYILLLACPFMHFFMHGKYGHGHGGPSHAPQSTGEKRQ